MDIKDDEKKETINFEEFRAWLTGLIRGKGGAIPDLQDWKAIKVMMDKVESEKEIVYVEKYVDNPPPFIPGNPYWYDNSRDVCPSPSFPRFPNNVPYIGDVIPDPFEVTCELTTNVKPDAPMTYINLPDAPCNVNAVANGFSMVDNDMADHPYAAGPTFEMAYDYKANYEEAFKEFFDFQDTKAKRDT